MARFLKRPTGRIVGRACAIGGAAARLAIGGVVATGLIVQSAQAQSYCATSVLPTRFQTAAFGAPMRYAVQTTPAGRVLVASGEIRVGEGQRLAQAIASAGSISEVWLNSPGGVLTEGMAMGRALRKSGILTRVANGNACVSACTFAFLGGPIRIIDGDAYYGVHMFSRYFDMDQVISYLDAIKAYVEANDAKGLQSFLMRQEQLNAQLAAECAKYLVEMSASLEFLTGTFGQRQTGICYLSRDGMIRYNVVNAS
ncbi:MAG: hypothetical protein ACOY45_12225 [Pseudomonadota bacterium]